MELDTRTEINPADYFSPDAPMPDKGLYRRLWYPVGMGIGGVGLISFLNVLQRRPALSGGYWTSFCLDFRGKGGKDWLNFYPFSSLSFTNEPFFGKYSVRFACICVFFFRKSIFFCRPGTLSAEIDKIYNHI